MLKPPPPPPLAAFIVGGVRAGVPKPVLFPAGGPPPDPNGCGVWPNGIPPPAALGAGGCVDAPKPGIAGAFVVVFPNG